MAITEKQRIERQKFLGSSDVSALFTDEDGKSLDPFKNQVDVWNSKVHEFEQVKSTASASIGHRYESALIEFAEGELGCKIETDPEKMRFICKDHPIFACNLDGFTLREPKENVEAKTTGLTGEWGEPGTDAVPFRVILQVHQQMLCTGMKTTHIAVLLGKWGLKEEMYIVHRNDELINAIVQRGEQFWNDYVLTKKPPPSTEPGNLKLFKKIVRIPSKLAEIDFGTILVWNDLKTARLDAEKKEKEAFSKLLLELGDAEGAELEDGRLFTYLKQRGADVIDRKKLKSEHPDVYSEVARENRYPVARIKERK